MLTQRLKRCAVAIALVVAATTPAAADDLSMFPVDSEFVGGLDLGALQNSALWKSMMAPMIAKNMTKEITELKAQCGIDAHKAINKVSFGLKSTGNGEPDGVIVLHGLKKGATMTCFDKLAKSGKLPGAVKRDGDVFLVSEKGRNAAITFANDRTAVLVLGANGTKAGIKTILKGASALKSSTAFQELYKKTNTGDTAWLIANGSSKLFDGAAALGFKPRAVYGSVTVSKDLSADVRLRMKTPGDASNLQGFLQKQAAPAQGMVDKLAITTDDKDVRIVLALSEAKLRAIATMMGGMMGGTTGGRP